MKKLLVCLLILLCYATALGDDTSQPLTIARGNRIFGRLDGTNTPFTGVVGFDAGIRGTPSVITCGQTYTQFDMYLPPLKINGVEYISSVSDPPECALTTIFVGYTDDFMGGGPSWIPYVFNCIPGGGQVQSAMSWGMGGGVDVHVYFQEQSIDAYGITLPMGDPPLPFTMYVQSGRYDETWNVLYEALGGAATTVVYKIPNALYWNTTTCNYDTVTENTNLQYCTADCDTDHPTFAASVDSWEWYTGPCPCTDDVSECGLCSVAATVCAVDGDCPPAETCNCGSYSGADAYINEDVIATTTYPWQINTNGNAAFGGTLGVTGNITTAGQYISTLTPGTAPFSMSSTTLNTNLNADMLDGAHAGSFSIPGHLHDTLTTTATGHTMQMTDDVNNVNLIWTTGGKPVWNQATATTFGNAPGYHVGAPADYFQFLPVQIYGYLNQPDPGANSKGYKLYQGQMTVTPKPGIYEQFNANDSSVQVDTSAGDVMNGNYFFGGSFGVNVYGNNDMLTSLTSGGVFSYRRSGTGYSDVYALAGRFYLNFYGSGSCVSAIGMQVLTTVADTAHVDTINEISVGGSGPATGASVTDWRKIAIYPIYDVGSITRAYGLYIYDQSLAATNYGIYIADFTDDTNDWGIYNLARTYLREHVGIGLSGYDPSYATVFISDYSTDAAQSRSAIDANYTSTATAGNIASTMFGIKGQVTLSGTKNYTPNSYYGTNTGLIGIATNLCTGTVTAMNAVSATFIAGPGSTTTSAVGFYLGGELSYPTATVTNYTGVLVGMSNYLTTNTTAWYGVRSLGPAYTATSTGSLTNYYGFLSNGPSLASGSSGSISYVYHYGVQDCVDAGSGSIPIQYGMYIWNLDDATTNYGLYLAAFTNTGGSDYELYNLGRAYIKKDILFSDAAENKLYVRDTGIYINSNDDGHLDLTADVSIDLNGLVLTQNVYPLTDNTYYLGKNDDDSPFAYKGVILKDTTNGKYYRIEVISGVVTPTDLTD